MMACIVSLLLFGNEVAASFTGTIFGMVSRNIFSREFISFAL